MAKTKNNSARMVHVSPGIYFQETDLTVASKSLGITSLGLVGETVKGPAFEPITIEDFGQFQTYFGGTNTSLFRGSNYPKYELPYIAQEYLKQSNNLKVCRVLGLSGVNAGPAWIITAYGSEGSEYTKDNPLIIGVLRSRGEHKDAALVHTFQNTEAEREKGICEDQFEYDKIQYYASKVEFEASDSLNAAGNCNPGFNRVTGSFTCNVNNLGTFTIKVTDYNGNVRKYPISLNPDERNYILNVLGTDPEVGDCELFVEELYDIALRQLVERGKLNEISSSPVTISEVRMMPKFAPVFDLLTKDESTLNRRNVGQRYLYTDGSLNGETNKGLKVHLYTNGVPSSAEGQIGHIYTVRAYTNANGTREYHYAEIVGQEEKLTDAREFENSLGEIGNTTNHIYFKNTVECLTDNLYYVVEKEDEKDVVRPVSVDWSNYKEPYRYASTPWIVSEMKGSASNVELNKLFRFHTISDGVNANMEVKVSIENIDPTLGTFDVVVRSFDDTDASPVVLERYGKCDLVPGSANYLGLVIGTTDGKNTSKSKYITVEINENDKTRLSIPAGFLGYPVRDTEGGTMVVKSGEKPKMQRPYFLYNTNVDDDIRINRQYFGISDITGIDEDILRYKGVEAYNDQPTGLSPCFHLDSRILNGKPNNTGAVVQGGISQTVSVDGQTGYEWVTVGIGNMTDMGVEPRFGDADTMVNTIYEDKRYRKFTVVFYGGWDGWDYYRTSRSIQDNFKYEKYRGQIDRVSGIGANFSLLRDPELYNFEAGTKATTADWYAYLSAIRKFSNPKEIDINVLATPGIDYVNNQLLVEEVIDMVENERADCVYVVTTPDKPFGSGDSQIEMYSADDAVYNLEDTGIDSNYTTTFYPWVKYLDTINNQYIFLPPTKDIVRNFAYTDNVAYPWFAAAGWKRGDINAEDVRVKLKVSDTDTLYSGRINYINCFAEDGMKLWGDRNLQSADTPLNRISKRRLLIRIRKLLSIACVGLLFDPNDPTCVKTMDDACRQVLDEIVSKRGIVDYRLKIDDSDEARARLAIPAKLAIKATPNTEFIEFNIILTDYGANFEDD